MSQPYTPGEQVPGFHARSATNPRFAFDTTAGRWVMVLVPGSLSDSAKAAAVEGMMEAWPAHFPVARALLMVIGTDPADERAGRLADGAARQALRATVPDGTLREGWMLLDPTLRVFATWPLTAGAEAMATLAALPEPGAHAGMTIPAPVLIVPRVFEPTFCHRLIALYESQGGGDSGFMRDVDGKTVGILDGRHKRRKDAVIEDEALQAQMRARISARLLPQIRKAFQFKPTRIERYIVACYDEADRGFFAPHRDNTTRGTAHRRFAVTINLNTGEYEGGELCFPEYGPQTYVAPAGGAIVFSCSLLHEARPVTKGVRYATLPFLYDEDAAKVRTENLRFLDSQDESAGMAATGG